jgi:hypothetical protein
MKDLVDFVKEFDFHTIIIVAVAFWFLNGNINTSIENVMIRLDRLEKDVGVIKTVLITKGIMPESFAKNREGK